MSEILTQRRLFLRLCWLLMRRAALADTKEADCHRAVLSDEIERLCSQLGVGEGAFYGVEAPE